MTAGWTGARGTLQGRTQGLLLFGSIILAAALAPETARADCTTHAPVNGETVTCDFATDPDTGDAIPIEMPILGPLATNVTLNISDAVIRSDLDGDGEIIGGMLSTDGSPAISLGGGAEINLTSVQVLDFDFGGANDVPTIALGSGGTVNADNSTILSVSPAAIGGAAGTYIVVNLTNGSAILTYGEDTAAVTVEPGAPGALDVLLDSSEIVTHDDGGIGISIPGAGSSLSVQLVNASRIVTKGDDAAAILAPGASSVFNLEIEADGSRPSLVTEGNNSPGVTMNGASSTATIQIIGAGDTPDGAGLQTLGDNSPLIELLLEGGSSSSFSAEDSSFTTSGDNSPILVLDNGPGSDSLIALQNASLATTGDNATALIQSSGRMTSVSDLVAIDSTISTQGDGSAGIYVEGADEDSSVSIFLAELEISTEGHDAPAFFTVAAGEQNGDGSVQTTDVIDSSFATKGDRSPGIRIASLNAGSSSEANIDYVEINTEGDWSPGFELTGVVEDNSAGSLSFANVDIATLGENSTAIKLGGFSGDSSIFGIDGLNLMLSTEGDGAGGFVIHDTTGIASSTMVSSFDMVTIETLGDDAPGFLHGTFDASGLAGNTLSFRAHDLAAITVDTQGDRSPGFALYGFGDGVTISDGTTSIINTAVTTQGNDSTAVLFDVFGADWEVSTNTFFLDVLSAETSGERSHGVIIGDGLGANGGIVDSTIFVFVANMTIATSGDDSLGLILEPVGLGATDSTFTTTLDAIAVETSGDRSHGFVLGGGLGTEEPGSNTTNELRLTGISSMTSGADAHALVISQGTTLTMDNGNLGDTTDQGTVVNGLIDSFDGFVATGPGGRAIHNEGILYGELSFGPGIVGKISNNGLIESETGAAGAAVTYGGTDDIFELQPMGVVIGTVEAGAGDDSFILGGTGTGSFDHTLIGTQYRDFEAFVKEDASIWTLTGPDSAAPFLPGTVTGGTLIVEPLLSGFDLMVESGGRLEGNGGVGNLTVGGTFAPGSSIGSFSVAGDLVFQPSSVFEVDIAANGDSDHVSVGGTTTLAGSIAINGINYPTGYPVAQDYTVITSQGTVHGAFDEVTDNLPDIDATVTVIQPNGPNPGEVIVGYDPADDESAKGIYPSTLYAGANAGRLFGDVLTGRGRLAGDGSSQTANAGGQLASADSQTLAAAAPARSGGSGLGLWISGLGQHIDQDSRNGRKGYEQEGYGGALGVEAAFPLGEGSGLIGAGLGYSWNEIDSGSASADLDAIQAGLYAGYRFGGFSLSAAGSYSWTETDFRRPIAFNNGGGVTARGDTDGYVLTGSLEAAYDILPGGEGLRVTPFAGIDVAHVHQDGFEEDGAGILNLTVSDESDTQVWSTLGVALGFEHRAGGGLVIRPELSLAWEHRFGGTAEVDSSIPAAAANFETEGVTQDRDRAVIGAGLGIDFGGNVSAALRYDGAFGAHSSAHRGTAGLTIKF